MKKFVALLILIGAVAAGIFFSWRFAFPDDYGQFLGLRPAQPDITRNDSVESNAPTNQFLDSPSGLARNDPSTSSGQAQKEPPLFTFYVFSDNEENLPILQKIIQDANTLRQAQGDNAKSPAFLVHLGDIIDTPATKEKFQKYAAETKKSAQPYYDIVGDNDIGQDGTLNLYNTYINKERYYSWSYKNAHFIALYNVGQSAFDEKQMQWLEQELKDNQDKQIFLFMHKPVLIPFAEIAGYNDFIPDDRVTTFTKLLTTYNVAHIYTGHAHTYFEYSIGKTPVTITGGAGGEPNVPLLENEEYKNHYVEVSVSETKHTNKAIPISLPSQ